MLVGERSYTTGHSALELNGAGVGLLNAVQGGEAYGDVIGERVGPDLVVRKHIANVRYSDIEIECGVGMGNDAYAWIADTLAGKAPRKSGAIVAFDYTGTEERRLAFSGAMITEVGFPALDAAAKDAAHIAVKVTPELTQRQSGSGTKTGVSMAKGDRPKQWLRSNFRLTIDGLDCTRVNRIESLVVRQAVMESAVGELRDYEKQPSAVDVGDLVLTLAESHAQGWYAWHHDFVVRGDSGAQFEKAGKLQFLAPNLQDVLFELSFRGLGIHRLSREPQQEGAAEGIRRAKASMYCEELTLAIPAGATSATATATGANGSAPSPNGGAPTAGPPPSRAEAIPTLAPSRPESLLPARVGASRIRPV
jgi:T4-like virus tail tube protein gp19